MAWSASRFGLSEMGNFWQLQSRELDRAVWENLRKGLDYTEKSPEPLQLETPNSSGNFDFGIILEIIRIAGAVILVLLLVFLVVKIVSGKRKKAEKDFNISAETEDIVQTEMPIDVLWQGWQRAKAAGQYREALRILYQIALKKLGEADKIRLHPEKTNWEYVTEIGDPLKSKEFADITVIYEMNWYGNSIPTRSEFEKHHLVFLNFIKAFPDENQ